MIVAVAIFSKVTCTSIAFLSGLVFQKKDMHKANIKNIFVSPYPILFLKYGSVGRKIFFYFFLTSQIPYPLNLIVSSPNIGN